MQVNTKEILLNPLFKGLTHCATLPRYRPSTVWTVCRNHISHGPASHLRPASPRHLTRHLSPGLSVASNPHNRWRHVAARRASSMTICFFSVYCLQIME